MGIKIQNTTSDQFCARVEEAECSNIDKFYQIKKTESNGLKLLNLGTKEQRLTASVSTCNKNESKRG